VERVAGYCATRAAAKTLAVTAAPQASCATALHAGSTSAAPRHFHGVALPSQRYADSLRWDLALAFLIPLLALLAIGIICHVYFPAVPHGAGYL
jgi:hypothetical protein